jgi:hypothetical protein
VNEIARGVDEDSSEVIQIILMGGTAWPSTFALFQLLQFLCITAFSCALAFSRHYHSGAID